MAQKNYSLKQRTKWAVEDYGLDYTPSPVEVGLAMTKKRVAGKQQPWQQVGGRTPTAAELAQASENYRKKQQQGPVASAAPAAAKQSAATAEPFKLPVNTRAMEFAAADMNQPLLMPLFQQDKGFGMGTKMQGIARQNQKQAELQFSRPTMTEQALRQQDLQGEQYSQDAYEAAISGQPGFLNAMGARLAKNPVVQAFARQDLVQKGLRYEDADKILQQRETASAPAVQATIKAADAADAARDAKFYAQQTERRKALEQAAFADVDFAKAATNGQQNGGIQLDRSGYDGGSSFLKMMTPVLELLGNSDPNTLGSGTGETAMERSQAALREEQVQYLTDGQIAVYNYYLGKGDRRTAEQYLKTLERALNAASAAEKEQKAQDTAANNGALGKAYGVGMNLAGNLTSPFAYLGTMGHVVQNKSSDEYTPLDINGPSMAPMGIQESATQGLKEGLGPVGGFLVDAGLSAANNVVNVVLFGASAPAFMAAQSAGQGAYSAAKAGATPEQAFALGTANGAAEYLGEKFSFSKLENVLHGAPARTVKDFVKAVGAQSLNEFTEESATEVMNILSEMAILRDKSDMAQFIQQYAEENAGAGDMQKNLATALYVAQRVGTAGLAGMLSGAALGGGTMARNSYGASQTGKAIRAANGESAVISEGLSLPPDTQANRLAAQLGQRQLDGAPLRNIDLGAQYYANGLATQGKLKYTLPILQQRAAEAKQRVLLMPLPEVQSGQAATKNTPAQGAEANTAINTPENMARFTQEVDGVFNGTRSPAESVTLGKTPTIYEQFGAQPRELTINPNTMYKIAYPEGYLNGKHNLGISALKHLPEQLQNPVAILRSQSQSNSLVVLTEWEDTQGRPVIVPLHLDKQGAVSLENMVASAYGRNGIEAMLGVNRENVLWTKGNEGIDQILSVRLQLPQAVSDDTLVSTYNIPNGPENVNVQTVAAQNQQARAQALAEGTAQAAELDALEKLAQQKGLQVQYIYQPGSAVDGLVQGDTMTVNLGSESYAFGTAVHETGHAMKAGDAKSFAKFQEAVLRFAQSDEQLGAYAEQVRQSYTAQDSPALKSLLGKDGQVSAAALDEEVSLKLAEQLVRNPEQLVRAVGQNRGLVAQFLDFVRGIKNSIAIKLTGSQKAMLDEAERTLVNLLRGKAGSVEGQRYAVRQDADGKPFVEIDEDILAGAPNNKKIDTVKQELRRRYPDGFDWRGWKIALTNKGINEFTRSKDTQKLRDSSQELYNDKMRTAANLDEIIEIADHIRNESPAHSRKDKISSFNRAYVNIRVGQNDYSAEVVTGIYPANNEIFYDIVRMQPIKIKDASASSIVQQTNATRDGTDTSSNNSISTQDGKVNGLGQTNLGEQQVREQLSALQRDLRRVKAEKEAWENSEAVKRAQEMRAQKRTELGVMRLHQWTEQSPEWQAYERRRKAYTEKIAALRQQGEVLLGQAQDDERVRKNQEWTANQKEQQAYDQAIQESGLSAEDYHRQEAVRRFGTTQRFEAAGYVLADGAMLDFSDGSNQSRRSKDHRDIQEVFGPAELGREAAGKDALNRFLAEGNVRVTAESPGVDIPSGARLSAEQLQAIRRMAEGLGKARKSFHLDISDEHGRIMATRQYQGNIRGDRVVNDIKAFYETGTLPAESGLGGFHSLNVPYQLPTGESVREYVRQRYLGLPVIGRGGQVQQSGQARAQRTGAPAMADDGKMENVGKQTRTEGKNAVRELIISHPIIGGVNNTQGAGEILAAEQSARKYARDFNDLTKGIAATANEVRNAKLLAEGEITLEDIGRNDRTKAVQRLAELQQQTNQAKENGVQGVKRKIFEMQQAKYKAMLANINDPEGLQVKNIDRLRMNSRTPERVFKKVFGAELGGKLVEDIITPIHYNESAKIQTINVLFEQARSLDLNETERRLVQLVGEGTKGKNGQPVTIEDIRKGNVGVNSLPGHMKPKEAKALLAHLGDVDAGKVERAVEFYRKNYDEFHDVINEFRVSRGLEPIGKQENYFPHYDQDDPLTKTMKKLGIEGVGNLPTSIAGQTAYNRPNSRWVAAFQHRSGPMTSYDCDLGFQTYVTSVLDMLYHTDDIMKLRSLDAAVRGRYTQQNFADTIDSILTKKNLKLNEEETALMEKVLNGEYMDMEADKQYANFASWLTQYTNKLANKQLLMDRAVEDAYGRMALNLPNEISGAFGRNSVVGNLSSALNNTVTLPKILATSRQRDVAAAVKGLVTGEFKNLGIAEQSEFLQGKKGVDYLVQSKAQNASRWISDHVFEPVEEAVTDVAFYTKYLEKMRNAPLPGSDGYELHQQSAIAAADEYAANMMARRTKGSRPLFMESKNPLHKLVTMFQTEVSNDFYSLADDLPEYYKAKAKTEEGKRQVIGQIASGATKYVVYSFALNTLLEGLTGYAPAPDPARWLLEFVRDLFDEDEEKTNAKKAVDAVSGLVSNVGDQVPYLSTALALAGMGNGRVPLPNYDLDKVGGGVSALLESDKDAPNKYRYAAQQLWTGAVVPTGMMMLPFGGNQLKKTLEGVSTMARGGMYKQTKQGEQLQTPVNNDPGTLQGAANWARAVMFGKSAIDEVGDYYDRNGRPMIEKKTQAYKELKSAGAKDQALKLLPILETDMSAMKLAQAIQGTELDEKQTDIVWKNFGGEKAREAYRKAVDQGLYGECVNLLRKADADGNGYLKKEEITAYLDEAILQKKAKRLLFELSSTAKNPY